MSLETALAACFESVCDGCFTYLIAPDLPVFKGHFPGNPLLPGVCELSLCADALGRLRGKPMEITGVVRGKFIAPVRPGERIQITLTARPDGAFRAEIVETKTAQKVGQLIFTAREHL